ncbi:MAG: MFS transporter [Actinobacteria bacterium]|nr:MAG: MFS transporter [Actinomycetota bacterium]
MNSLGPGFNRLWGASLTSNLADGLLAAAAPLLAITLTKSPVLISLLSALVMLPWLFFAIPIGVIVDRVDRRFLLAGANSVRFLIAGILAISVSTHTITIYYLFIAAFLIGICEVFADTTAQSLIPQILEKSDLEKGNSRLQISETIVQGFIGTPISGFLYAAAIYLPFIANSLGFLVAAILAFSIPVKFLQDMRQEEVAKSKPDFMAEIRFGIHYLYNHKVLRRLVLTTASVGFCYSMATATIVLFIIKELHLKPALFGVVLTIQASGAILGGLAAPKLSSRFGRSRVMGAAILISSVVLFLQGLTPNIYLFVFFATLGSFAISQWNILLMSTYQSVIPANLFGRVHGTRRTLVWGMMPLGSLLGGFVATTGLRTPLIAGGIVATLISLLSLRFVTTIGQVAADGQVAAESPGL